MEAYKTWNNWKRTRRKSSKPITRNGKVRSIVFDIDSLSELVDIDPNVSTFTQTFSNLFQFDPNIPHHEIVDEEWK